MEGGGFEPPKRCATDLQSAPFGHSGNLPRIRNADFRKHYSIRIADVHNQCLIRNADFRNLWLLSRLLRNI